MLIFRHVFGFFIQLFPYAFFCCYPFLGRFKRGVKKAAGTTCGIAAMGCVLFVWLGLYPPVPALAAHYELVCNLIFALTLGLLLAYFLAAVRAGLFQKLFVFFIVINYGYLVLKLTDLFNAFIQPVRDGYMYSPVGLLLQTAVQILLFFPILLLLKRIRRAADSPIEDSTWKQLALVPLGFILLINLCLHIPGAAGLSPRMQLEISTMAVLVFMFFVYGWIFRVMERSRRQAEEAAALQFALSNYRRVAENIDRIKEMHHEMKHHLNALAVYLDGDDAEGAKAYLSRVADDLARLPAVEYTPHPLLNSILTEYEDRAGRAGIRVEYHILVPETLPMEDVDLCRLLTNLLYNAIEGCADAKGEKYLSLRIRRNGRFLFFGCENACDGGKLRYEHGRLISRKADWEAHGCGLKIMAAIADKYSGLFKTGAEGDRFTAQVNLCLFAGEEAGKEGDG